MVEEKAEAATSFTNLSSAKLKLQDYTTSIKSIKTATKNIGEMERELRGKEREEERRESEKGGGRC